MTQSLVFIVDLLEFGLRTLRPPRRSSRRPRWNIGVESGFVTRGGHKSIRRMPARRRISALSLHDARADYLADGALVSSRASGIAAQPLLVGLALADHHAVV